MILLVGPSASGKTEVAKILKTKYNIVKAITTTSRSPRVGEIDGVDYFFVSKEQFEELKNNNWFVETTFYNGNYYGCGKNQVKDDKCVIVDPNGLESFINLHNPNLITFYLNTSENVRKSRMISRGDGIDKANERIKNDTKVFANIKKTDFVIDNENQSLEQLADTIYTLYIKKINN